MTLEQVVFTISCTPCVARGEPDPPLSLDLVTALEEMAREVERLRVEVDQLRKERV